MVIKGQKFYDMLNADTVVKFGVSDVEMVTMETVVIETYDDDFVLQGKDTVYLICVLLMSGMFVATKPHHDQDFVATIGHKLADMCKIDMNAKWN